MSVEEWRSFLDVYLGAPQSKQNMNFVLLKNIFIASYINKLVYIQNSIVYTTQIC